MKRFLPLGLYALMLLAYAYAPALPASAWRIDALIIGGGVLCGFLGLIKAARG